MMVFSKETQDLLALINDTKNAFDVQMDLKRLDEITDNFKQVQHLRTESQNKLKQSIKSLSSTVRVKESNVNELSKDGPLADIIKQKDLTFSKEAETNRNLREVNAKKTALNNTVSRLLDELDSINAEFGKLDEEPSLDDLGDKALVLKLSFYKRFGVTFDEKKELIIIFNKRENFSDFLNLDGEKFSDYFVTNYVWDRI